MKTATTKKCVEITDEMPWKERLREYRKLDSDFHSIMSLAPQEPASISSAMSAEVRQRIVDSLPIGLPLGEFKRELYFRTYGEHLPDDYFRDEVESDG